MILEYYTAIIMLSIFAMLTMLLCLRSTCSLSKKERRFFCLEFCTIALAALSLRMKELRKDAPLLPTVSLGYTAYDPMKGSLQEALELADQKMYRFKQQVHAGENAESI